MGQKVRVIPVPAAGGVPVVIRCTQVTTRMTIQESTATEATAPAGNTATVPAQGLVISLLTPEANNLPNSWTVGPALNIFAFFEPFVVAGYPGDHPPNTVPIGNGGSFPYPCAPGGPVTTGTPICQVTSGGTATDIIVTEWD